MLNKQLDIELLFETSWEVCNKIGGIYTVLSTKAKVLHEQFGDKLIFIGPDVWSPENPSPYFIERKTLLKNFVRKELPFGLKMRVGRWDVPSSPLVVLVDFNPMYAELNRIYGEMWESYGVDSLHAYGDYAEGCAFATAAAVVMKSLAEHLGVEASKVTAHFNEWTTGMGLLYLEKQMPEAATLFTTHATSIGRSICSNGKPLYDYFEGYHGDQMASELNMESKHSLEKCAAWGADCFTTVSEVTARECEQLLDLAPQVVTPNGFEADFVPAPKVQETQRATARKRILAMASALTGKNFNKDTFIIATSGRHEYRNKGIDLFIESVSGLRNRIKPASRDILALILVPGWVNRPCDELIAGMKGDTQARPGKDYLSHRLNNEGSDEVLLHLDALGNNGSEQRVTLIYVPVYLDGKDGVIDLPYYKALPGLDLTVFPSYYEPWGYTPLESIAFGVPTITTDKAGFGQWILSGYPNSLRSCGVKVETRGDSDFADAAYRIGSDILSMARATDEELAEIRAAASRTSRDADWQSFITEYYKAFEIALKRRNDRIKQEII